MLNHFTYGSPVLQAILNRNNHSDGSVRRIDRELINTLLDVGMRISNVSEWCTWSYVIIQDENYLKYLSNYSCLHSQLNQVSTQSSQLRQEVKDSNLTSLQGSLIVVCANLNLPFIADDCWFGVENILLAASALGYRADLHGALLSTLNSYTIKSHLSIPDELTVLSAISIGWPDSTILPKKVSEPKVWRWL